MDLCPCTTHYTAGVRGKAEADERKKEWAEVVHSEHGHLVELQRELLQQQHVGGERGPAAQSQLDSEARAPREVTSPDWGWRADQKRVFPAAKNPFEDFCATSRDRGAPDPAQGVEGGGEGSAAAAAVVIKVARDPPELHRSMKELQRQQQQAQEAAAAKVSATRHGAGTGTAAPVFNALAFKL